MAAFHARECATEDLERQVPQPGFRQGMVILRVLDVAASLVSAADILVRVDDRQRNSSLTASYVWVGLAAGDFNGDGKPDVASTRMSANAVSVVMNQTLPVLKVQRTSAGVRLLWPDWAYDLERSTNLNSVTGWQVVSNTLVLIGNEMVLSNSLTEQSCYYRLKKKQ
jgi:hypothetical protein